MSSADIVILLAVVSAVIGAVLSVRRNRKAGKGCCGDCTVCHTSCNKKADA